MIVQRKKIYLIDQILSPLAVIAPLFTAPQFYEVWVLKKAGGVSSLSWLLMGVMAVLWFGHAYKHKDNLLMLNTSLMIFFNFSIAIGATIYG